MLKFIPRDIIHRTARETGVDVKARTYSVLSHLGTMLFVQLAHALSLNDVCDWLRLKARAIAAFGLTPPSRNNLSNSNKVRDAKFAELVFWRTLAHLQHHDRSFGRQRPGGHAGRSLLHRFKVRIHAVDSTVIELVANCMNWAKHRRRKAAAKMHLRLGLNGFLPTFAIVDTAGEHDNKRAREVCAGLEEGEVVVFDKAYVDFGHLHDLDLRGVQWVTRAKDNFRCRALRNLPVKAGGNVVKDQVVQLTGDKFKHLKGWTLRRVEAWVEVDGALRLMVFITNNTAWSPGSVCDLYRARWDIEVFFKQVKQTLKLGDFASLRSPLRGSLRLAVSLRSALGHSANAIRWQVWTALLLHVLLRYAAHIGQWGHSFTRLFAVVRAAMWERLDLTGLLRSYGTAGGSFTLLGAAHAAWLPGFEPAGTAPHGTASA
ncbi:MAG: IS4 family transposase ISVsp5 [Prosthecobacter sp.]|nr:IS4 family transposase ISVsp5 [Prosthecobacter sp.]